MTAISIAGMGLTGMLQITWVRDNLAHVLDHSHTDETCNPSVNVEPLDVIAEPMHSSLP